MKQKFRCKSFLAVLLAFLTLAFYAPLPTVGANVDSLEVISAIPSENSGQVSEDSEIVLTFSQTIQKGELFELISVHTEAGTLQKILTIEDNKLIIKPATAWPSGERISVIMPIMAIQDSAGFTLMESYTHSFTVTEESKRPYEALSIRHTIPAYGQQNVNIESPIQLQFNEVIHAGSYFKDIKLLHKDSNRTVNSITQIQDDLLWLIPEEPLEHGAEYEIIVPEDAVQNLKGASLAQSDSYYFTTLQSPTGYMMRAGIQKNRQTYRVLDGGIFHSIALKPDGSVWTWGSNSSGRLGIGSQIAQNKPVRVKGVNGNGFLNGIISVSAGGSHNLALGVDGTVWSVGSNFYGQLGDGTTTSKFTPIRVKGMNGSGLLTDVVAIAGGSHHSAVLKSDGTVWSWGQNQYGQLGEGSNTNRTFPVQAAGENGVGVLSDIIAIDAGPTYMLALQSDGTVWSWGHNLVGRLGDGTTINRSTPVKVKGPGGVGVLSNIVQVSAGSHSLALTADGKVWSWGTNGMGQLGDNTTIDRFTPVAVLAPGGSGLISGVSSISAGGGAYSLALKTDGSVWGWGSNYLGLLGIGTGISYSRTPLQVKNEDGNGVFAQGAQIAAGEYHALAVKSNGEYWGWAHNTFGQLGNGNNDHQDLPVRVVELASTGIAMTRDIGLGDYYNVTLKPDGTVWSWGYNASGRLGDGTATNRKTPVQVKGAGGSGALSDVVSISTGESHTIVLKSDGTVWSWGINFDGRLGDSTTINRNAPVQVMGPTGMLTDVTAVSAGTNHSVALKSDGTVWSWGSNTYGRLGDGTTTTRNTPVQVKGNGGTGFLTNIVAVSAGGQHTLALSSDGTLWAWGYNYNGQLGDGTTVNRSTPVQVKAEDGIGNLSNVAEMSAGNSHSLVLKRDGTVRSWGSNSSGRLGNGTTASSSIPVQVKGIGGTGVLSHIISVSAGNSHSTALKSDGTAVGWGYNYYGSLGDGTTTTRTTPVQVRNAAGTAIMTGVVAIQSGNYHTAAITSEGKIWTWGYNYYGQLGEGTTSNSALPKLVKWPVQYIYDASNRLDTLYFYQDGNYLKRVYHYDDNGNLTSTETILIY